VALYERVILLAIGSSIVLGFAALMALTLHGVLWLLPSLRGHILAIFLVLPVCLAVLIPGLLVGGGLIMLAFSSKKDLESLPP
jgi:hypothetical protein